MSSFWTVCSNGEFPDSVWFYLIYPNVYLNSPTSPTTSLEEIKKDNLF